MGQPLPDAGLALSAVFQPPEILANFRPDGVAGLGGDRAFVNRFGQLTEAQSNQHAQHDDADFTN